MVLVPWSSSDAYVPVVDTFNRGQRGHSPVCGYTAPYVACCGMLSVLTPFYHTMLNSLTMSCNLILLALASSYEQ